MPRPTPAPRRAMRPACRRAFMWRRRGSLPARRSISGAPSTTPASAPAPVSATAQRWAPDCLAPLDPRASAGGDHIHAISGVMSGSLAWLFHQFDGSRPFSELVREARDAGFTEPDPREDLSGEDVRRKILILARSAGFAIESDQGRPWSLKSRGSLPVSHPGRWIPVSKSSMHRLHRCCARRARSCSLRFVARVEEGRARVGLEKLCPLDALHGGGGTDNRVAIWSDRYRIQPLVIQGPGAGADVDRRRAARRRAAPARDGDRAAACRLSGLANRLRRAKRRP